MHQIRRVEYFHATVRDEPGQAFGVLSALSHQGVNLLAFTAVPMGDNRTQLTLFPESGSTLARVAKLAGLALDGPFHAILVQGDDHAGELADLHEKLTRANVNVYSSSAVTDGRGAYGYIIHIRPAELDRAIRALEE
jgi:hypothetical protein